MAQTFTVGAAPSSARRRPIVSRSSTVETFGTEDAVGRGLGRHREIVGPPSRVEAVGPDQDLALAEPFGRDRGSDPVARQCLRIRRDGVFQIEDQAIGGEIARLFQRAGVGAGHEQMAAARAGHASVPSGFLVSLPTEADSIWPAYSKGLFAPAVYD
ncbi:hypothetical protein ACVWWP_008624 [Bradyrhizobium sp. LM3.6]